MRQVAKGGGPPGPLERGLPQGRTLGEMNAGLQDALAVDAWAVGTRPTFDVRGGWFDQIDKPKARAWLFQEQAGRCAFCERPVRDSGPSQVPVAERGVDSDGMVIAHFRPIADRPDLALTWGNLFGSCDATGPKRRQHCDAIQGATPPPAHAPTPADVDYAAWLEVRAVDGAWLPVEGAPDFVPVILKIFNLNVDSLKVRRRAAVQLEQEALQEQPPADKVGWIERRLTSLLQHHTEALFPSARRRFLERELEALLAA